MKWMALTLALAGCSSNDDLFDTFTNAITFEVPYTTVSGTLPAQDPSVPTQVTETAVLSTNVINESRFQYFRNGTENIASNLTPGIQVLGSFNGGGAQIGRSLDTQNDYEFQNYTSINHGKHAWRFGARVRGETDNNISPQDFGGTFIFSGGLAPVLNAENQAIPGQTTIITSIEQYRRTLLGLPGGVPTQFTINSGNPVISGSHWDLGAFAGDDWKVKPNRFCRLSDPIASCFSGIRRRCAIKLQSWKPESGSRSPGKNLFPHYLNPKRSPKRSAA